MKYFLGSYRGRTVHGDFLYLESMAFRGGILSDPTRPLRQADRDPRFATKLRVDATRHYRSDAVRLLSSDSKRLRWLLGRRHMAHIRSKHTLIGGGR